MITRRGLIRAAGIAAPAIILRPSMAQFDSCLPGICGGVGACTSLASSHPFDGLSPTGAWSPSRALKSAYVGSFYTLTTGRVSTLFDQSGNARDMITQGSGTRPTIDSSNNCTALSFDGVSDWLAVTTTLSDFISAASGYMIATIKPTGFPTDNAAVYLNSPVLSDNGANACMTVRANGGSPLFYCFNWPTGQSVSASIAANIPYVVEWRHEGGVLYQRLNGAGETSIVSGNTDLTSGQLGLGGRFLSAFFQGLIYEAAIFSTVPSLSDRNALVQNLGHYNGASV